MLDVWAKHRYRNVGLESGRIIHFPIETRMRQVSLDRIDALVSEVQRRFAGQIVHADDLPVRYAIVVESLLDPDIVPSGVPGSHPQYDDGIFHWLVGSTNSKRKAIQVTDYTFRRLDRVMTRDDEGGVFVIDRGPARRVPAEVDPWASSVIYRKRKS